MLRSVPAKSAESALQQSHSARCRREHRAGPVWADLRSSACYAYRDAGSGRCGETYYMFITVLRHRDRRGVANVRIAEDVLYRC